MTCTHARECVCMCTHTHACTYVTLYSGIQMLMCTHKHRRVCIPNINVKHGIKRKFQRLMVMWNSHNHIWSKYISMLISHFTLQVYYKTWNKCENAHCQHVSRHDKDSWSPHNTLGSEFSVFIPVLTLLILYEILDGNRIYVTSLMDKQHIK